MTGEPRNRPETTPVASKTPRKAVVVLGMHRSGTSALTRVLSLLGASLPADLQPPLEANNEMGFWEPWPVIALNEELLDSIGLSWDDVGPLPDGWFGSAAALDSRRRAAWILGQEYRDQPFFVLKDPRISRLAPVWFGALEDVGAAPLTVQVIRHPLEVAASLAARDRFTEGTSLLLWLRHVLEAELHSRGRPRAFVLYDELLRDWRGELQKVGAALDLSWTTDGVGAQREIDEFLSPRHRHHEFSSSDLSASADAQGWVEETFDAMRLAAAGETAGLSGRLDEVRGHLLKADAAIAPAYAQMREWRRIAALGGVEVSQPAGAVVELRQLLDVSGVDNH